MTDENDRMDRAKRIREMREGARADEAEDTSSEETEQETTTQTSTESTDGGTPGSDRDDGESDGEPADSAPASAKQTAESEAGESGTKESGDESVDPASTVEAIAEAAAEADVDAEELAAEVSAAEETDGLSAPLPEMEQLEAALSGTETAGDPETVTPAEVDSGDGAAGPQDSPAGGGQAVVETEAAGVPDEETDASSDEEETRVLEFTLDDEHYCLDIQYIEEIVKHEAITRVPNTAEHVEGVVDLRGQITTILNPKVTIGKENREPGELIVVFDAEAFEDQGHIGWVVDDVRQVAPIVESEVNEPPMAESYVNGVIDREDDDEFVIWTSPDLAFEDDE